MCVNHRFVDRDMLMRYVGLGIGHLGSNSLTPEEIEPDANGDADERGQDGTAEQLHADMLREGEDQDTPEGDEEIDVDDLELDPDDEEDEEDV
jgi:hypothetical protein